MAFRMTLMGVEGVQGQLRNIVKNFEPDAQKALMEEMEIERQEVIRRIPKDTTALASSTHLIEGSQGRKQKNIVGATISVGDDTINPKTGKPTKEYAAQVHEDMEANHPHGGQAKYLESVLKESSSEMSKRVARRLDLKKMAGG